MTLTSNNGLPPEPQILLNEKTLVQWVAEEREGAAIQRVAEGTEMNVYEELKREDWNPLVRVDKQGGSNDRKASRQKPGHPWRDSGVCWYESARAYIDGAFGSRRPARRILGRLSDRVAESSQSIAGTCDDDAGVQYQ